MNKKTSILLFFGFSLFMNSCSSAPASNGIIYEKKNDAAKTAQLGDGFYREGKFDSAILYYESALEINTSVDNDAGIISSKTALARCYLALSDLETATKYVDDALERATSIKDNNLIAEALNYSSEILIKNKKTDEALLLLKKAEALTNVDQKRLAIIYANIAMIYKETSDYKNAQAYLEKSISLNNATKSFVQVAQNYYLLSSLYVKTNELDKAYSNAAKALEIDKQAENSFGISSDYYALGRISYKQGKIKEAYAFQKKAFETALASDNISDVNKALKELAILSKELKLETDNKKWEELLKEID